MTRNKNALMRDGSVMVDSDLVDFLSGSRDSAINFSGSADLHTPIQPRHMTYISVSCVTGELRDCAKKGCGRPENILPYNVRQIDYCSIFVK